MRDNPYKDLPPLERRPDGSLYRMTPAQRKQAASLIRRECCCFEDGNCIVLDDGDTCTCPQTISFSVCCTCQSSAVKEWIALRNPSKERKAACR